MKNMFKVFGIIFIVMMIGFFAGCGEKEKGDTFPSKLRGTWNLKDAPAGTFTVEVSKNDMAFSGIDPRATAASGAVTNMLNNGEWYVDGNVIGIETSGVETPFCTYQINGNELTLEIVLVPGMGEMVFVKQ